MGVRLKNIGGKTWRSWDFDGTSLRALPGQEVEMSEARASKVLKDYPRSFVRVAEVVVEQHAGDTSSERVSVPVQVPLDAQPFAGPRRGRRGKRA